MTTFAERREELIRKGSELIEQRKAAGEELTAEDRTALADYKRQIDEATEQIGKVNADAKIIAAFEKLGGGGGAAPDDGTEPGKGYSRATVKATAKQIVKLSLIHI